MKKLLVTVIGAAAAFGASAGLISTQRFETATITEGRSESISALNTLAGGDYWSGDELTNTYKFVARTGALAPLPADTPLSATPTKALEIKTTFGSPLKLNAIAGNNTSTNIPASGIYFDSLVKFTVCEDAPEQTYEDQGAKIVMWLQEQTDGSDNITGTNIMVRANYINSDGTFTPTNFTCYAFDGDIEKWHRVTIKTWSSIMTGSDVPGFAIFIDNELVNTLSADGTMATTANLTEAAAYLGKKKVFASLVQGNAAGKSTITSASFDGTGYLTDIVFTDEAPFEEAEDYVAPEVAVTIGGEPVPGIKTLAQAIAAINGSTATEEISAKIQLSKGLVINGTEVSPIEINLNNENVTNVVIDFAGKVLTNTTAFCAITNVNAALTFTDSSGGGGILCSSEAETAGALWLIGGSSTAIENGIFNGNLCGTFLGLEISGGSFLQGPFELGEKLADGKKFKYNDETGLYDVEDATYTVLFISGEGSTTQKFEKVYNETIAQGDVSAAAAVVGKTFSAWDPVPAFPITVTSDATYTAVYTAATYGITYYNGETPLDLAPATYTYGVGVAELPTTSAADGYQFDGWYTNAELTGDPVTSIATTATGAKEFYAKFSPINYTITFDGNGGTTPNATNFTVTTAAFDLPIPTLADNTFAGWTNETYTAAFTNFNPQTWTGYADFKLYAKWVPNAAPVVPVAPGTTDITPPAGKTAAQYADQINGDKATYISVPADASPDYLNLFKAEATSGDKVQIVFDQASSAYTDLTNKVEAVVTAIPVATVAGKAAEATTEVAVPAANVKAGLWYSISSGSALGSMTEGSRTQATSSGVTLTAPTYSGSGFYKVLVNPKNK